MGGEPEGLVVWLLRHAKAMTDPPAGGTDHDRHLAPRGRRDAAALGRRLSAGDLGFGTAALPDLVLASSAARTSETAEKVASALGTPVDRRGRLYYGSTADMLDELRGLDNSLCSVMIVGHNPATHSLALGLLSPDDGAGRAALGSFPTCAIALLLTPATRWSQLAWGTATLAGFARPPYDG